jgi:hypothetical protein
MLWLRLSGILLALGLLLIRSPGQCQQTGGKSGSAVATCVSVAGALLELRPKAAWEAVKAGDRVGPGVLLVALPKAELLSANKAVTLNMLADIGQRGPYPVLESAVRIHANADADLDVTLDRGIMAVTNAKKTGAAKVRIRVAGKSWDLLLKEPGSKVGLELFGRHPPGAPKVLEGKIDPPTADVILLVTKGQAFLHTGKDGYGLQAPPGPAFLHWDSVLDRPSVDHLDKLPEALTKALDDKEAKLFHDLCHCTLALGSRPIDQVLDGLLKSDTKVDRLVGVTVLGAVDKLPALLDALANSKHADMRDHAVLVLRTWMGRGPGQVEKLHQALTQDGRYSKVHARTILQLMFGFNEEDRSRPDTYELLIALLNHPQVPVRELARWHLVRLAPAGKDIAYDAGGPEAERQRGSEQWRALIPEGKLPPRPKDK